MRFAASLLLLVGCSAPPSAGPRPPIPVTAWQVPVPDQAEHREYSGEVRATDRVELAFEVSGRIVEILVDEGQRVKKGDVLARLDDRDFRADLRGTRARLEAAEADYSRTEQSFVAEAVSKRDLDVARRQRDVAAAEQDITRKALEDATLRAPFSGVVAKRLVDEFVGVSAKEPVLYLEDAEALEVVVEVPETDFAMMRPGVSLEERSESIAPEVLLASMPDLVFPARLYEYSTSADPVTRTFSATFAFDRTQAARVLPGMTARVRIRIPEQVLATGGVFVPVEAVTNDYGPDPIVFVIDDDKALRKPVRLGQLTGSSLQVLEGLSPGDRIVRTGLRGLRDQSAVQVVNDGEAG